MAQVTGLDPEASVTSGNGASYPRTVPPGFSSPSASAFASASGSKRLNRRSYQNLPRSTSQFQAQARTRPRAKSTSNMSARPSQDQDQDVRFNDDTFISQKEDDGELHDGIAELIDFLRNHSPPSGNFMSIPDDISPEDRGRWYRLRKLGKRRRSLSKSPQTIRLPDSAVSGTTIGGHRHIAISIPLDASPFGRTPRSQYPVYQQRNARPLSSRYGPTRAVVNDKGVVTVLRTVKEDRETSPSVSPANSQLLLSSVPQRSPNNTTEGQFHPGTINSSIQARSSEHSNVMATPPPRVVSSEQVRQANEQSREFQNYDHGNTPAANPSQHERASSRNSNSAGGRFVHLGDLSIDTMMSQPVATEIKSESTSSARPVSRDGSYQHSLSKSIMTTSDNDPVVGEARPVEAKSVAARESRILPPTKPSGDPSVTIITKSPLRVSRDYSSQKGGEESPASSSKSPQNRRDKVRDKKKRDLEAASLKRRSMMVDTPEPKQDSDQDTIKEMPEDDTNEPPPVPLKSPQRQSICPIMVVANVKPSPPLTASISTFPERKSSADSETVKPLSKSKSGGVSFLIGDEGRTSRPISPSPVSYMNGSPTPPQSARSSPTHEQSSHDRTSLFRRREWNAARDIERKRKEAASSSSPQPRTRRATTGRDENDDKTTGAEVLRRYEAYREYRIREMERRVRRLERNGDVWLRALVPVLDNLNRTLASSHDDKSSKAQGWVSDDDDDKSQSPKPSPVRPSSRGRMMTRAGTSEREFLEQLVRTREELEAGSISDDMSGFDTIEPLMRELAGRSRLSFEARSLGMDDEGLLQSLSQ
ncbi:hypothetical protein FLAG1_05927 [Fusarium langsethiae]|uniref:Uncharacterized protein n=1 Tax=Fusarium langsethiae TaxID=179993 RepID=A0A0N0DEJ0_FUSLA|nr:hypothetical protein FLAG1_05927 [Fusarium langsethiae]GKU00014.1 unnamed protein product [Fusarium langsethiae]GKU15500.1 unnamed protein product [Fusarium langsethiae]